MLQQSLNILLVEDNLAEAKLLQQYLTRVNSSKFAIERISNLAEAIQKLKSAKFSVVLLDLSLPDSEGLASVAPLLKIAPQIPIVVLTNTDEDELAVAAVSQGAQDYLVKDNISSELLRRSIDYAIRSKKDQEQLHQANARLQAEIEKREKLERELKLSNKELEQFAYVVSHDLKQPLSTISSWTQMLDLRYRQQLDQKGQKYIRMILDGAKQMEQLIQDLLNYSRINTKGKEFALTNCEDLLRIVKARLERAITESHAKITHQPLPKVMADAEQLGQLLQNLLDNGIKYHSQQPPQINIWVTETDSEWVFAVQDNGIGIESKYFARIFQVFQRLHTQSEYPGTGIGLAICQRIVKRHGGKLWVESEPGVGSTFYFTLLKMPYLS